jgi:uncharacterized protein
LLKYLYRKAKKMIVDFHYHYINREGFIDDLLKEMEEAGIDKTVLTGLSDDLLWESDVFGSFCGNMDVLAAVRKYPDRLIGGIYIDPREKDFMDTFEKYFQEGFKYVKIWPPLGFYPDDEILFPMYEKLEKYDIPLLSHTGLTNIKLIDKSGKGFRKAADSRYAHPMNFDKLSRLFPKMKIIFAHSGHPHYFDAWGIAYANKNVYLDIAGGEVWVSGIPYVYNAIGGRNYIPIDFDRVIWGSDNCLTQKEHLEKSIDSMKLSGASDDDIKKIIGKNAARLMGLV